ncbi:MAG: hypothetical protein ABSG53_15920 [Thermoguttaceae bacterium]
MPSPSSNRPPLGLPRGSIRALLTLMIVGVVITQLVRGGEIHLLWTETLMIAMAHYFASRRFIRLPPEEIKRLVDEGYIELEARPLYLPSYTIRLLLIASFIAVGIYLYLHDRWREPQALSILGVVFAYLLGVFVRMRTVRGWEDAKAFVVLTVTIVTSAAYLLDYGDSVPRPLQAATLGLVLFYFGSR